MEKATDIDMDFLEEMQNINLDYINMYPTFYPLNVNLTDRSQGHGQLENISQPEQQISVMEDSHSEKGRNSIQKDLKETVGLVRRPLTDFNRSESFSNGGSPFKVPNSQSEKTLYTCDICNKTFSKKSTLATHMRIHSGDKPYLCEVCKASFNQRNILVRHARKHTGEKPFVCKACGASFARNETLIKHKRRHTGDKPFVCKTCGASFAQRESFITHERRHTGNRPFVCKACGASFAQRGGLIGHERRHTGEKPYSCSKCSNSFRTSSVMRRHERRCQVLTAIVQSDPK